MNISSGDPSATDIKPVSFEGLRKLSVDSPVPFGNWSPVFSLVDWPGTDWAQQWRTMSFSVVDAGILSPLTAPVILRDGNATQ